jgi:3'-5' exonuclease
MLEKLKIENVLFLDIETVPLEASYDNLSEKTKQLWDKKAEFLRKPESETSDSIYNRAGIYAEFGKIVCISVGIVNGEEIRLKSFADEDEKKILTEFNQMLENHYKPGRNLLCAHNGKEFDFPFIARRTLINGLKIPEILDLAGKKPWEIPHLDTMELWKFGDYKHYTSLELLAHIFNIPTPKDDIRGADVHKVFWQEKDLERIVTYCQKDVITIIQLFLKYQGKETIDENNIQVSN